MPACPIAGWPKARCRIHCRPARQRRSRSQRARPRARPRTESFPARPAFRCRGLEQACRLRSARCSLSSPASDHWRRGLRPSGCRESCHGPRSWSRTRPRSARPAGRSVCHWRCRTAARARPLPRRLRPAPRPGGSPAQIRPRRSSQVRRLRPPPDRETAARPAHRADRAWRAGHRRRCVRAARHRRTASRGQSGRGSRISRPAAVRTTRVRAGHQASPGCVRFPAQ